jgi:hypothetical protein
MLTLFWDLVILFPILGFELLFRAVVWIVAGFLHSGDSKSQTVEMAHAYSSEEIKKKINKLWSYWISDLKKTRLRDLLWTAFLILWIFSSSELIANTSLSPFSHWRDGGLSFPLQNLDILTLIKVGYFIILTALKGIFDVIVLISGLVLYQVVSSKILKKIDSVEERLESKIEAVNIKIDFVEAKMDSKFQFLVLLGKKY